jgi:hypothetical protein
MTDGTLEEVLIRLCDTGPERHGWLSNHTPLAVEVLVRHGQADEVHRWIDDYRDLLEDPPQGIDPIAPATRDGWGAFKRRLAASVPDLADYGQIKAPATEILMGAAERWAAATGWTPESG